MWQGITTASTPEAEVHINQADFESDGVPANIIGAVSAIYATTTTTQFLPTDIVTTVPTSEDVPAIGISADVQTTAAQNVRLLCNDGLFPLAPASDGAFARKRKPKQKRSRPQAMTPNMIATCSEGGSTDVSASPVTNNGKTARKLNSQTSVEFIDLPDDSEDSQLSDSCDENELEAQCVNTTTKPKPGNDAQRQIVPPESDAVASAGKYWKQNCSWTDGAIQYEPDGAHRFSGMNVQLMNVTGSDSPLQFFRYFFTDEIIQLIADETALYSVQQCPHNPLMMTKCDVERFLGIVMNMSLVRLASSRDYWSSRFRVNQIADVMSFNNFGRIKRFLHFGDDTESSGDRLKKLRTLVDKLRNRFISVPLEQNLSVDEQLIPFKGKHGLKQHLPRTSQKWGYKVFVLSGVSGYAYDFEIYSGEQDNTVLPGEADCGASGNVVMRLSRTIPSDCNYRIFFDNYFNSVDVQLALARRGILSLGTVHLNRLRETNLMSDAELAQRGRGAYQEKVMSVDGVQLSVVRWFDNRLFSFLSTFVGTQPISEIKRYNKARHEEEQVSCPKVVHVYNQHVGGIDLLESLVGKYRTKIRSRKWYHRVFFHLLDLAVVNAWLLYRRCHADDRKPPRLHDFKADIAEGLCKQGKDGSSFKPLKRGRTSSEQIPAKRQKALAPQPCADVRYDGIGHWPRWRNVRGMCRVNGCKCVSRVVCSKCHVSLCHNPRNDCFYAFHQRH